MKEKDNINSEENNEISNKKLDQGKKINLVEEKLKVSKVREQVGEVIINKDIKIEEENVSIPLTNESYDIERIKIGKEVNEYPQQREIDGKIIIPVVKEKLVIIKQLVLEEEIHITKKITTETKNITETVRKEVIDIKRK